ADLDTSPPVPFECLVLRIVAACQHRPPNHVWPRRRHAMSAQAPPSCFGAPATGCRVTSYEIGEPNGPHRPALASAKPLCHSWSTAVIGDGSPLAEHLARYI